MTFVRPMRRCRSQLSTELFRSRKASAVVEQMSVEDENRAVTRLGDDSTKRHHEKSAPRKSRNYVLAKHMTLEKARLAKRVSGRVGGELKGEEPYRGFAAWHVS